MGSFQNLILKYLQAVDESECWNFVFEQGFNFYLKANIFFSIFKTKFILLKLFYYVI